MIKNYKPVQFVTDHHSEHLYTWADDPAAGFSFTVDATGKPIADNPAAAANLKMCQQLSATGEIIDRGIQRYELRYSTPATGTCHCGERLHLAGDTRCSCGRLYNSSGQELHSFTDPEDPYYSTLDY